MKYAKVDFEHKNGYFLINIESILYIMFHESILSCPAYAQIYFSEGRASIILNEEQYKQLLRNMEVK